MQREDLVGKWSVYDVTQTFKDMDASNISKTLASLDSGVMRLEQVLNNTASSGVRSPSIKVEIMPSGEMKMSIVQSMQPGMPTDMNLSAIIKWELNGDRMLTQAVIDTLEVRISIDADHHLPADKIAELRQKISEVEANTLQNLKNSPQWTNSNTVSIIYCGRQYFLTKSEQGTLMLHYRNL